MTNNLSNHDAPDDDLKISEDQLREFLESSQQDIDYEKLNNSAWGANVKDREIIDFIERVNIIRQSMEEKSGDSNRAEMAELIDLIRGTTDELRSRTLDPALIERLVDAVSYHSDAIISILKQLSNLRVIVFTLAGMLIIQSFALGIVIGAIR
jgi:hypothetical protein